MSSRTAATGQFANGIGVGREYSLWATEVRERIVIPKSIKETVIND